MKNTDEFPLGKSKPLDLKIKKAKLKFYRWWNNLRYGNDHDINDILIKAKPKAFPSISLKSHVYYDVNFSNAEALESQIKMVNTLTQDLQMSILEYDRLPTDVQFCANNRNKNDLTLPSRYSDEKAYKKQKSNSYVDLSKCQINCLQSNSSDISIRIFDSFLFSDHAESVKCSRRLSSMFHEPIQEQYGKCISGGYHCEKDIGESQLDDLEAIKRSNDGCLSKSLSLFREKLHPNIHSGGPRVRIPNEQSINRFLNEAECLLNTLSGKPFGTKKNNNNQPFEIYKDTLNDKESKKSKSPLKDLTNTKKYISGSIYSSIVLSDALESDTKDNFRKEIADSPFTEELKENKWKRIEDLKRSSKAYLNQPKVQLISSAKFKRSRVHNIHLNFKRGIKRWVDKLKQNSERTHKTIQLQKAEKISKVGPACVFVTKVEISQLKTSGCNYSWKSFNGFLQIKCEFNTTTKKQDNLNVKTSLECIYSLPANAVPSSTEVEIQTATKKSGNIL